MMDENNSKERILYAAIKLFAEKGFEAASTREICKEAGVNLCMISYYFGGKQELYNAILDKIFTTQTEYISKFFNLEQDVKELGKTKQIDLLLNFIDKSVDFFYSNITSDLIVFMIKAQQSPDFVVKSPAFAYLRRLIAAIFNKKPDDRDIIYKTLFIIAQVNCSRVFPAFSLRLLNRKDFSEDDIKLIKTNVKNYIYMLLGEENIV